jgi:L-ascorbate metabolism protein UlaG (beta-lactamase superfamily)
MKIIKYHQSGFMVESQGKRLAVDIGKYTPVQELPVIGKADANLVSHFHPDHCSAEHLSYLAPDVYTVQEAAETLKDDKTLTLHIHKVGDQVVISGTPFIVTVLPSDHGPHVGEVENTALHISDGTHAVYFLGDMYNPAAPIAEPFDALMIPVGNDKYTFGPPEAASYIRELQWDGLTIPVHYAAAKGNEQTADEFATLIAEECIVRKLNDFESLEIA